jgi:uncharacterized protein
MSDKAIAKRIHPTITAVNRPFWEGCRRGELLVQRCTVCSRLRYPASGVCPHCLATASEWQRMSGNGTVFSFVVFHRAYHDAWESRVPYNVCLIELAEGPMMLSNVIEVDNAALAVGLLVVAAFEPIDEDLSLPVFKLADAVAMSPP